MKIGLIGTGRMGTALGGRLLDGGHSLRVFDLDPMSVVATADRALYRAKREGRNRYSATPLVPTV